MLRLLRFFLLGLVLLLVFIASALVAMRFAIHGREVRVPQFHGLTTTEAERRATANGLVLAVENRFFSADVPEGRIVSQSPAPGLKVRRGIRVRVAESLGSQRNSVPGVIGQSERVAEMNITRRGHEVGSVAGIHFPGAQPSTVIAQSPPEGARNTASPRVSLLVAAPDNAQTYVMPSFVGHTVAGATKAVERAGLTLGKVETVESSPFSSGIVARQWPPAGQKIEAGAVVNFEVAK